MARGVRRPLCWGCQEKRVPDDERYFCSQRCGWHWAEANLEVLLSIGINDEGEFEMDFQPEVEPAEEEVMPWWTSTS
jgi:hypothetical protein